MPTKHVDHAVTKCDLDHGMQYFPRWPAFADHKFPPISRRGVNRCQTRSGTLRVVAERSRTLPRALRGLFSCAVSTCRGHLSTAL